MTCLLKIEKGKNNMCPIPECPATTKDKFGMYRHFCFRHVNAKIIINEDGELSKCKLCGKEMKKGSLQQHM